MIKQDLIIHRGNSPFNTPSPLEQASYYIDKGFRKIEIDIYALSETGYKFCHPLDADRVDEIHELNDGFLESLVKKYPDIEWLVDLKCLDLDEPPEIMMEYLSKVFGVSSLFIAAQQEILEYMHHNSIRTAQYFKNEVTLSYEPDFYMQDANSRLQYPSQKTILYCTSLDQALEYLDKNFAGIIIDGNLLI